ncbi:LCP family protein [Microbacterium sp. 10M-3C3]|jgi:LCP family protein required for cell wall assembly|uniref:LCP family protein n=1 Tax=Microbacterium sp. 10M-3C3 TaxID=2483401 RepID=UPI000F62D932|nr:LCP family protein [Microbacterium sp. 10M-3C3]
MARRRRTVARHARLRSPGIGRQIATVLGAALAVVLVASLGTATYALYDLNASLVDDAVALDDDLVVPPDIGQIEGGVNLFLTGIDECEDEYAHLFGNRCKGAEASNKLNDVNILLHISDAPRRVTVVSFPRDLIIQAPGCTRTNGGEWGGGTTQINALFEIGGLACATKAVSRMSGQDIPFAATVTFGGVIEVTNAVGGVEVCLAKGIRDRNTGIDWPAGPRTVSGIDALQFLRTRYGVGDQSDLARVSNQQQYMSRLARKLASDEVLSNPATLYRLATGALDSITPNDRLTNPLTAVQIGLAVKDVPFDQIAFVQYPTLPAPGDPNRVVPNQTAAQVLWDALAANQPIDITGGVSSNGGTVEVTPTPAPGEQPPASAEPTPTDAPTAVALPPSITGSTAAQETCSSGNLSR